MQSDESGIFEKVLELKETFEKFVKSDAKIEAFLMNEEFKIKNETKKKYFKKEAEEKKRVI